MSTRQRHLIKKVALRTGARLVARRLGPASGVHVCARARVRERDTGREKGWERGREEDGWPRASGSTRPT